MLHIKDVSMNLSEPFQLEDPKVTFDSSKPKKLLLRIGDVMYLTGFTKSSIYQAMRNNMFPKCVRFNGVSIWYFDELEAWVEETKKLPRFSSSYVMKTYPKKKPKNAK